MEMARFRFLFGAVLLFAACGHAGAPALGQGSRAGCPAAELLGGAYQGMVEFSTENACNVAGNDTTMRHLKTVSDACSTHCRACKASCAETGATGAWMCSKGTQSSGAD